MGLPGGCLPGGGRQAPAVCRLLRMRRRASDAVSGKRTVGCGELRGESPGYLGESWDQYGSYGLGTDLPVEPSLEGPDS